VRGLLDSHVWLWMLHEPERLSSAARRTIEDSETELWLSSASTWEMGIKLALGKLRIPVPLLDLVGARLDRLGVAPLHVTHAHAIEASSLPLHHGDPFDRMLVAQARIEGLVLITADRRIEAYDVEVCRAD